MQGGRLALVILLVVLAGCTIPFAGGDGEVADDAGVTTENNATGEAESDDADSDDEGGSDSDERELTVEEAQRAEGYENLGYRMQDALGTLGSTYPLHSGEYRYVDGEWSGVTVVTYPRVSPEEIPSLAGEAAYVGPRVIEEYSEGVFAVDNPSRAYLRPEKVVVEFEDEDGTLLASYVMDVDEAREFAQGETPGETWAEQTIGSLETYEDVDGDLPDRPANEYFIANDAASLGNLFNSLRPNYTTYNSASADAHRIYDAGDELGYGLVIELDEDHVVAEETVQAANTMARVLEWEYDDLNETGALYLDDVRPEYVELEFRNADGELLGWLEVNVDLAVGYINEEVTREEFLAETVGDFDIHKAGLAPEPDEPVEALREAELHSFASDYEMLVLDADHFPVNATYIDLDRDTVMIHGYWDLPGWTGATSDQTFVHRIWRTVILQPELHHPEEVHYYTENPLEEGNKRSQNDNRGYAEVEPGIEVADAQERGDDDAPQMAIDYEREQGDNMVILEEDAINPADRPQDDPFSEDDDGW